LLRLQALIYFTNLRWWIQLFSWCVYWYSRVYFICLVWHYMVRLSRLPFYFFIFELYYLTLNLLHNSEANAGGRIANHYLSSSKFSSSSPSSHLWSDQTRLLVCFNVTRRLYMLTLIIYMIFFTTQTVLSLWISRPIVEISDRFFCSVNPSHRIRWYHLRGIWW